MQTASTGTTDDLPSPPQASPLVGVLALQGDFADHERALQACGLRTRQIRKAAQLDGIDGLVLPGGESTTMLRLLDVEGLWQPLGRVLQSGLPVLATCAGMILCAQHVENPRQRSYGVLPITVVRNGYGRQFHSGTFALEVGGSLGRGAALGDGAREATMSGTFIRAPRITAVHTEDCEVLARRRDEQGHEDPVLVRYRNVLAACFHPELRGVNHPVTQLFAASVRNEWTRARNASQPVARGEAQASFAAGEGP
ncbi:MAG: pyridoxal 5'-phosphate synthase glutaminase subunit PdxT [Planctomycetota bacterium]